MNTTTAAKFSRDTRPRTGALVAGIGLLAMAVIAGLSSFGVIDNLTIPGDPDATAANLVNSAALFRLGAIGLVVVAILDVAVAWGLYIVLRSVNPSLSLLGAWFRVAYAAIFVMAINSLFSALRAAPVDPAQSMFFLETFQYGWQMGLILFGIHLGLIGFLVWRSPHISWIFGVLLVVSGVGYVVDGFGTLLDPAYSLALSTFTFVGEVAFIFWLLVRGSRLPDGEATNPSVDA
jgi:hypothetical protein